MGCVCVCVCVCGGGELVRVQAGGSQSLRQGCEVRPPPDSCTAPPRSRGPRGAQGHSGQERGTQLGQCSKFSLVLQWRGHLIPIHLKHPACSSHLLYAHTHTHTHTNTCPHTNAHTHCKPNCVKNREAKN